MPTVDGRYVPEWHAAALAAAATPADEADEPTETPKRATRKRGGKKAETAMVDLPDAED